MNTNHFILCFASLLSVPLTFANPTTSPVEQTFTAIYRENQWGSSETVSGPGSEIRITYKMINQLSDLIKKWNIQSIADAPCGDLNWMQYVNIGQCAYTGYDIVQDLIERNIKSFATTTKTFKHANLLEDIIDPVDLIICRDMLAHLTYEQIFTVLQNFKKSGSKYLLATTGRTTPVNSDILSAGGWRRLNLELAPFNFPKPLAFIEENVPFELERGKHLALWRLEDLDV